MTDTRFYWQFRVKGRFFYLSPSSLRPGSWVLDSFELYLCYIDCVSSWFSQIIRLNNPNSYATDSVSGSLRVENLPPELQTWITERKKRKSKNADVSSSASTPKFIVSAWSESTIGSSFPCHRRGCCWTSRLRLRRRGLRFCKTKQILYTCLTKLGLFYLLYVIKRLMR